MWLAQSDLDLARFARNHADILPEQICFHAQQAAEKSLKAVLVARRVEFRRTHDIAALLELAEKASIPFPPQVAESKDLTPYAVQLRYPMVWTEITEQDADRAIRLAEATVAWAVQIIGSERKQP